jgi:hypothetical protein
MDEAFKFQLCGSSGEHSFSWDGNCLVCEDEGLIPSKMIVVATKMFVAVYTLIMENSRNNRNI